MNIRYNKYREQLPDKLNIQHKIADATEKKSFHLHSQLELIYALSDNLICYTENKTIAIPAGSILLLSSKSLHYIGYKENSGVCDRYVLYFDSELLQALSTPELNLLDCFIRLTDAAVITPDPEEVPVLLDSLQKLESAFRIVQDLQASGEENSALMFQLFMKLELGQLMLLANRIYYRQYGAPTSAAYQSHSQTVTEICSYIDEHYAEPLSTAQLARQFLLSKTQLYSLFKEVLALSVSEYISLVRVTQAKHLLINTQYSVEIISQKVGYTNACSFSRLFRSKIGSAPLQYRKKMNRA